MTEYQNGPPPSINEKRSHIWQNSSNNYIHAHAVEHLLVSTPSTCGSHSTKANENAR